MSDKTMQQAEENIGEDDLREDVIPGTDPERPDESDDGTDADADLHGGLDSGPETDPTAQDAGDTGDLADLLEQEGDIAADYLEGLLDIADLDGDIDMDVENDRAAVSVVGGDLGTLVGRDGEVLDALQELTRLAVQRETGERSRLMLDIGGHRAQRRRDLEQVAARAVEQAREQGEPVALDPMNAFERKVVHDAVAAAGLRSDSAGVEPHRHVVVHPAASDED